MPSSLAMVNLLSEAQTIIPRPDTLPEATHRIATANHKLLRLDESAKCDFLRELIS